MVSSPKLKKLKLTRGIEGNACGAILVNEACKTEIYDSSYFQIVSQRISSTTVISSLSLLSDRIRKNVDDCDNHF